MESFNIKRFWRVLRWYVSGNRGTLVRWLAGTALGVFAVESIYLWVVIRNTMIPSEYYANHVTPAAMFCSVCLMIAVFYAMSSIFSSLRKKQQRIAFFMLPATQSERYLSTWLFAAVLVPLCIFVAFFVGDSLRALLFMIFGWEWQSGWINVMKEWGMDLNDVSSDIIMIWVGSVYVLVATVLRKNHFLFASLFFFVLLGIAGGCMVYTMKHIFPGMDADTVLTVGRIVKYAIPSLLAVAAVANYWLSYRLFKRFQIITSKTTNL